MPANNDDAALLDAFEQLASRSPVVGTAIDVMRQSAPDTDVWVVGGAVRDLLMGIPASDLDMVVEHETGAIAEEIAQATGWSLEVHDRFGTAALNVPGAPAAPGWLASRPRSVVTLDIARARTETYPTPGALPKVSPAGIEADLARRDFTVNAVALCVHGGRRGEVLDPHDGRADLSAGVLRLLHDRSAWDDPTRILRGIRYRAQLGMRFASSTEEQIGSAIAEEVLTSVSSDRVRHEIERWFGAGMVDAIEAADRAGVAGILFPGHEVPIDRVTAALAAVSIGCTEQTPLGEIAGIELHQEDWWTLLCAAAGAEPARAASQSYELATRVESHADTVRRIAATASEWMAGREAGSHLDRPALAELAGELPTRDLRLVALAGEVAAGTHASVALDRLAETLADLRVHVGGDDIIALGIPEGPRVRELLDAIWFAALSGYATTEAAQRALLARAAAV